MKKLFVVMIGFALLILSVHPAIAQQMRALSGAVVVKPEGYKQGTVVIRFDEFPNLHVASPGVIDDATIVGGKGNFETPPAIVVHLREWSTQDNTKSGDQIEEYIINSEAFSDRMNINWEVSDDTEVYEIGFLAVGEAAQ